MRKNKILTVLIIVLLLVAVAACGAVYFFMTHIFIEGKPYSRNAEVLNLRGVKISGEEYDALREELPGAQILWDVPVQGEYYPDDTTELTISAVSGELASQLAYLPELKTIHAENCEDYAALAQLQEAYPQCQVLYTVCVDGTEYSQDAEEIAVQNLTEEDLERIEYLPQLSRVHADGCQDYGCLKTLQERHPQWEVTYQVEIAGAAYDADTAELTLEKPDVAELAEKLAYLPKLEKLMLRFPDTDADSLLALREMYPGVAIDWEVEVLGIQASTEQEEIDISALNVESTDVVGQIMEYFPDAEKVYLGLCQIDNETLAAYREEKRAEYKVVWQMQIWYVMARTDDTWFMPGKYGQGLTQEAAQLLRYCEDMICIDIGHKPVQTVEWVEYMPHLKYLILAHTSVKDITPLSSCKELIYLEIDWTVIRDYTPLLGCTALQDLNLGRTHGDITPITQMTWLKNLWWKDLEWEKQAVVKAALPNTNVQCNMSATVGNGWRELQNYYDMRDILGMEYMGA